jgi:tetratricopeptide (TPR) repeat protein
VSIQAGPRALVIATFIALTTGFIAGYALAPRGDGASSPGDPAAPHAVGPDEYLQLGMQSLEAGDYPTAERYFRRATELVPENAAAHTDLAVSLMYQNRWTDAHGELEVAGRLAPETPEVYFLKGVVYRDGMSDSTRARDAWEKFLTMVPPDSPQAETVADWIAGLGTASDAVTQ